jgi:hypothetical protein
MEMVSVLRIQVMGESFWNMGSGVSYGRGATSTPFVRRATSYHISL